MEEAGVDAEEARANKEGLRALITFQSRAGAVRVPRAAPLLRRAAEDKRQGDELPLRICNAAEKMYLALE